jgi:dethiobiotin synthetase
VSLKSFFITATDTGVGKTTVTAAIAFLLKNRGIDVGVMKPFATGTQQKTGYKSEDVTILANAAQSIDPEEMINPYFFPIPTSPYSAANKLNAKIDPIFVIHRFEKLQSMHQVMLVEGIGGIMTPILKDYCVGDLIKDMNLETIIVTSSRLGTVNHTLMTVNAAQRFGLKVRGLIINNIDSSGYDIVELKSDLTNLSGIEVLCTIPHFDSVKISDVANSLKSSNLVSQLMS